MLIIPSVLNKHAYIILLVLWCAYNKNGPMTRIHTYTHVHLYACVSTYRFAIYSKMRSFLHIIRNHYIIIVIRMSVRYHVCMYFNTYKMKLKF